MRVVRRDIVLTVSNLTVLASRIRGHLKIMGLSVFNIYLTYFDK